MGAAGRSCGGIPERLPDLGREEHLAAAIKTWDFIDAFVIDRRDGEWYTYVSREGVAAPGLTKVDFWKCPYTTPGHARDHGANAPAGAAGSR